MAGGNPSTHDLLRDVPALLLDALRNAPIGIAAQDLELRYTWAPLGAAPLGAAPDAAVVGQDDRALYPADAAARLVAAKRRVLAAGENLRTELAVAREGPTRHFDVTLEPLRAEDGTTAGVITVAFDVTERKRVEEEVARSRARLAEAEHVAHLGSYEWDIATNAVVWSPGLFEVYGVDPADWEAQYRPSSDRIHPDDRARVDAAVHHAVETAESIDLEYRILRPDGRVRRVRGRAEVIVDADGRPIRLAGTVTEVRATADALQQTAAELTRRAAELQDAGGAGAPAGRGLERMLTVRQAEILALVAEGLSNAEIAHRLFLSEATVKWHVRKILRALGVSNRAQAVARYLAAQHSTDR